MCKKKQFKYCPSEIDECMRTHIYNLNLILKEGIKIVACCCGHQEELKGKYPMTIVVDNGREIYDLVSGEAIPRKKKFYKKDKQGYYFIPEVVEN